MAGDGQTADVSRFVALHVPVQVVSLTEHEPANQTRELFDFHMHHVDVSFQGRLRTEYSVANGAGNYLRPHVFLVHVLDVLPHFILRRFHQTTLRTGKVFDSLMAFRVDMQLIFGGEFFVTDTANEWHLLGVVSILVSLKGPVGGVGLSAEVADKGNRFRNFVGGIVNA